MTKVWRLLQHPALNATRNMSIDLSLLNSYQGSPVLRFYSWQPHAISLGRFQDPAQDLYLNKLQADAIPWVRRMTGGGAIYHQEEITYSLVCSFDDISTRSVKDSFKKLCRFLVDSYQDVGLDAGYAIDKNNNPTNLGGKSPFCFAGQELYDIIIGDKKLGGNAQRRYRDLIFQHGSIPIRQDIARQLEYFRKTPVTDNITSLSELMTNIDRELFQEILIRHFKAALNTDLLPDTLTEKEQELSLKLEQEIFSNKEWNAHARIPRGRTV